MDLLDVWQRQRPTQPRITADRNDATVTSEQAGTRIVRPTTTITIEW